MDALELALRAGSVVLPLAVIAALCLLERPPRRRIVGAALATIWTWVVIFAVNLIALRAGWWTFRSAGPAVSGVPIELLFGWGLLWGAIPTLAAPRRLGLLLAGLVAFDLVCMPLMEPVLRLGPQWLVGEALAVVICLIPGMALGHWTEHQSHVYARVTLQGIAMVGLMFLLLPSVLFAMTGDGWAALLERPVWHFLLAAILAAPAVGMVVQATLEFAAHGGTAVPWDPPTELVTTGPYAYVANPMQVGAVVLLAAWAVLTASFAVLGMSIGAIAFSIGVTRWNEAPDLSGRFGPDWVNYTMRMRSWLPRWRPVMTVPAQVLVGTTCSKCAAVGSFIERRRPTGLAIVPAETSEVVLTRITYRQGVRSATGVAGATRSLEHVHFGWALVSWVARMPVVRPLLQVMADALGAGPQPIGGTACSTTEGVHTWHAS